MFILNFLLKKLFLFSIFFIKKSRKDLFGSDDEDDEEAERIKAERVAAYNARKSEKEAKKGVLIYRFMEFC